MSSVYQHENGSGHQIEASMSENMPVETSLAAVLIEQGLESETSERFLKTWRKLFNVMKAEMAKATDMDSLLATTATMVREKITCDRTLIYRFENHEVGVVASESLKFGWTPAKGENLPAVMFGLSEQSAYQDAIAINHVGEVQTTPYQKQLLEKFQVQGSLAIPITLTGQVWGLLVVHQCDQPRVWNESEIGLLSLVADEFGHNLQVIEIEKQKQAQAQEYKSFAKVIDKIQRASSLEQIFQTTVKEARQLINCDRVSVYKFNPDWSGEYIAESVGTGWTPLVGGGIKTVWEDPYLQENQGGRYRLHESMIVSDIYKMDFAPCHIDILEQFQIRAYITIPVFCGQRLWGILAGYQNSDTRSWKESEIELFKQFATSLGVAVSQQEYLQQLQQKSEEQAQIAAQEKAIAKIVTRIRQSSELQDIFWTATKEAKQLVNCDRVSVYKFNPDWSGEYIAESVGTGWTPLVGAGIKTVWEDPYLQENQGGRYRLHESMIVSDIYKMDFAPCHVDILEQFQIRAYITIPIFAGEKLWGIFAGYQSAETRSWKESEIELFKQFATSLGVAVSQQEYLQQLQQKSEEQAQIAAQEKAIAKIVTRIRQSLDVQEIFKATTQELRQLIKTQRVGVYKFNPDWSGDFVAESFAPGLVPIVSKEIDRELLRENGVCETITGLSAIYNSTDNYLRDTQGGRYQKKTTFVINDVKQAGFADCYLHLLEQLEAQAYITAPIFNGEKLWGLLTVYHTEAARKWEESETNLVTQVAAQFGVAIAQAEYLNQAKQQAEQLTRTSERQQDLMALTRKIGESLLEKAANSSQIDYILQTIVGEVRRLLQADRTVVYRFNPDWSGDFIAESVAAGWLPFQEKIKGKEINADLLTANGDCDALRSLTAIYKEKDTYMQDSQGGRYKNKQTFVVNDVLAENFPPCYTELLDQFEAKAYLTVPIFQGNKLWGLLASYQHSSTREWQESEVAMMQQITVLVAVAIQQAETYEQLEKQSQEATKAAEIDQAVSSVIDKIRKSTDIESIFNTTTKEVRNLLKSDRVVVFKFNPDWSGNFVAESVGANWIRLVEGENKTYWADSYLQETQGGRYRHGEYFVTNDLYTAGHADCHVEILEQYQARAYVIVPILQGDNLWGLMAAYQNSGTREWQQAEINLLMRVADQFGVALQQVEYLETLKQQSAKVSEAVRRERENTEQFQKQAIQLLAAVRPALDGDLTVRAPITEDVLGTIADAYNNTLQALRQIVAQVLGAAEQVAIKSQESNASLGNLTGLARQQSKEINEALMEIQQMVDATEGVVANTEVVQSKVQQANQTVEQGDAAMDKTVEAIQAIRETVAQTSKKIKRLSESSQKISKVVNLISSFATQTNVLALNAAIEATRAGEYGKGFAVVADEVRSLSRQSAAATIEIEKLVQEIQEETGEVAVAMETGIQQVVEGTNLVSETRQSLSDIVTATAEISQLLQQITEATQGQMMQSVSVTASMKDVAQIANRTSSETNNIAVVFEQLSEVAQELLSSSSQFKVN